MKWNEINSIQLKSIQIKSTVRRWSYQLKYERQKGKDDELK